MPDSFLGKLALRPPELLNDAGSKLRVEAVPPGPEKQQALIMAVNNDYIILKTKMENCFQFSILYYAA